MSLILKDFFQGKEEEGGPHPEELQDAGHHEHLDGDADEIDPEEESPVEAADLLRAQPT